MRTLFPKIDEKRSVPRSDSRAGGQRDPVCLACCRLAMLTQRKDMSCSCGRPKNTVCLTTKATACLCRSQGPLE